MKRSLQKTLFWTLILATGLASAAGIGTEANNVMCRIYNTLNGPIGWGLGLLMLAYGALLLMTGNRDANSTIIGVLIGGIVLSATPALLGMVNGGTNPCKDVNKNLTI